MRFLILCVTLSIASLAWSHRDPDPVGPPPGPGAGPAPGSGGPAQMGPAPDFGATQPMGYQPAPPPDDQNPAPPPPRQNPPPQRGQGQGSGGGVQPIQVIQYNYAAPAYPPPGPGPKGPPGKARMTEFKDTFETMVEDYVDAHSRDGFFVVKPENSEIGLRLKGDGSNPKDVRKNQDGEAIGVVMFTDKEGEVAELEFHATKDEYEWSVSRVLILRLGDKVLLAGAAPPRRAAAAERTEAPKPAAEETLLAVDMPPKSAMPVDPESFAVVVGVEKYRDVPKVDFASRDAQTVYDYLTHAMGYDPKNVALLQDDRAGLSDLETYLGPWLSDRISAKSKVLIYYAGHGAPNPTTGEGYLIPYDGNPTYVDTKAFPIKKLYTNLAKLPSKNVTVVLDACFSGAGGRSVLAKGARPLVLMKQGPAPELGSNTIVLTAARSDQISTFDQDGRHGLLTYYFLKGLRGEADTKKDGKITMDELFAYVAPAVERAARLQHVEQSPTVLPVSLGSRGRDVLIKTK